MARVVCTLVAKGWIEGVLCSRMALGPVTFWRIQVKVDICRLESCICHAVRDPQLGIIGSNHHCSSVKETQSTALHHSYGWNFGLGIMRWMLRSEYYYIGSPSDNHIK
jgi:hypothetical protein